MPQHSPTTGSAKPGPSGVSSPRLSTPRLLLRAMTLQDAARVSVLASDPRVSQTMLSVPAVFDEAAARGWIQRHLAAVVTGRRLLFAVVVRDSGELIGAFAAQLVVEHARAELAAWIGADYWGHGYATEAGQRMCDHLFDGCGMARVAAEHLAGNGGTHRVLRKLGMTHEGTRRSHYRRGDKWYDAEVYGLLAQERPWLPPHDRSGAP